MSELRMDAYYYSFTPTGVGPVDLLLSAVASAGKAFHHTECWNDTYKAEPYRGTCPVEWIQNAAADLAAFALAQMTELEHRRSVMSRFPFCPDHRDKVAGLECRECEIERLKSELEEAEEAIRCLAPNFNTGRNEVEFGWEELPAVRRARERGGQKDETPR